LRELVLLITTVCIENITLRANKACALDIYVPILRRTYSTK